MVLEIPIVVWDRVSGGFDWLLSAAISANRSLGCSVPTEEKPCGADVE